MTHSVKRGFVVRDTDPKSPEFGQNFLGSCQKSLVCSVALKELHILLTSKKVLPHEKNTKFFLLVVIPLRYLPFFANKKNLLDF